MDAHLCRTVLEDEGIEVFLADENLLTLNPLLGPAPSGIRLQVLEPDAQRAAQIVETFNNDTRESPPLPDQEMEEGEEQVITCPNCGLDKVQKKKAHPAWQFLSGLLLGLPTFFTPTHLECKSCGHVWKQKTDR